MKSARVSVHVRVRNVSDKFLKVIFCYYLTTLIILRLHAEQLVGCMYFHTHHGREKIADFWCLMAVRLVFCTFH
jgi:hypothetical protein